MPNQDGYTVLLGSVGTHAYNQSIYRKRRYDAVSDFTPVTLFSDSQMVLEGRKDLPANNLAEFIALLKQNGTKMNTARQALDRLRILLARCSTRGSASTWPTFLIGVAGLPRTTW
jgi:tripartite-type tricarboxylate transporter receptor subunit TctC